MEEFFFKGQLKIIRKKLIKVAICFFIIGLFMGTFIGQYWRMEQVETEYQNYISGLKREIQFYKENYKPR